MKQRSQSIRSLPPYLLSPSPPAAPWRTGGDPLNDDIAVQSAFYSPNLTVTASVQQHSTLPDV